MSLLHLNSAVTIGTLQPEYAANMYRWMCDSDISENLGLRNSPSMERTVEWIAHAQKANDMRVFAILLNDAHVGNVVIDRIDDFLATARLSVYIGEPVHRGVGIGLTGMYLAINHSFNELSLHKIWLIVHARNFRAINVYNKLGFTLEGILRDEFLLRGERLAALYMGLLHSDFEHLAVEWS